VVFCGGSCDIRGEVSVCFRSMRDIIEDWMKLLFSCQSICSVVPVFFFFSFAFSGGRVFFLFIIWVSGSVFVYFNWPFF
jgi:hypothetical protein